MKRNVFRRQPRSRVACAAFVFVAAVCAATASAAPQGGGQDIQLRSFARGASGSLVIEPSAEGGRARLTALALPEPESVWATATAFVVWAVSGGRTVRLGELRVDARGHGGLEFARPASFERYSVIVTAEQSAEAVRPAGSPVLSTRAGEALALFPTAPSVETTADATTRDADAAPTAAPAPKTFKPERPRRRSISHSRRPGDFYDNVDDALDNAQGGARTLELVGAQAASHARGTARVTARSGAAYVRVRFRDLPLPPSIGANTYVLWGAQPGGRIVYMGSLPATADLNTADIYVRVVGGFDADDYALFVTAERQRPAAAPSDRRALTTKPARDIPR